VTEHVRRPVVGYAMVIVAATFFGINGPVSKVALSSGLSSLRLTEARSAGAFIGLMLFALLWKRDTLRLRPGEWRQLALFGVVGVASSSSPTSSPSTGSRSGSRC
jgi:drug/metabolite transporter (DMT)-like permease